MPLTSKGEKIKRAMEEKYGSKEGEKIFYASKNKGTITGVDSMSYGHPIKIISQRVDAVSMRLDAYIQRRSDERKRKDEEKAKKDAAKKDQEGNPHEELRKGALSKDCM